MICPYCGNENPDGISTCNHCGGWLEDVDKARTSDILPPTPVNLPEAPPLEPASEVNEPAIQPEKPPAEQVIVLDQSAAQPEIYPPEQYLPPGQPSKRGCAKWLWWIVGCFVVLCLALSCVAVLWGFYSFSTVLDFLKPTSTSPALISISTTTQAPADTFTPVETDALANTPIPLLSSTPDFTLTLSPDQILATPGVLYYDNFSDPNSGWDRVNESDYMTDYFENTYRITENKTMGDVWANPDDLSFEDVSVEVDATKNSGPNDNDFGVICRYQDTDHFYYALISSDGYYGIIKVNTDGSASLGRDNLEYSDSINQGYATNHIRIDCVGDVLTLYVNGDKLDQQTDSEYSSGNVGLIAGTYNSPGTDILFDNFVVYQP